MIFNNEFAHLINRFCTPRSPHGKGSFQFAHARTKTRHRRIFRTLFDRYPLRHKFEYQDPRLSFAEVFWASGPLPCTQQAGARRISRLFYNPTRECAMSSEGFRINISQLTNALEWLAIAILLSISAINAAKVTRYPITHARIDSAAVYLWRRLKWKHPTLPLQPAWRPVTTAPCPYSHL